MSFPIIHHWDADDYDAPFDTWVACNQAYEIANLSSIRISSKKELKLVALNQHYDVIGAIWVDIYKSDEMNEYTVYDFDVAVHPQYRNNNMVGIKLINNAIRDYESLDDENKMIRVFVVNPRLVSVLEKKYGFQCDGFDRYGTVMYHYQ